MQWKLVSAFSIGAVLASGIVYFAVKPDSGRLEPGKPVAALPAPLSRAAGPVATPVAEPTPPPSLPPSPAPAPSSPAPAPLPVRRAVREKPSPMPPPVRRQKELVIAHAAPPAPTPVPQNPEPAPPAAVEPTPPPDAAEPAPVPVQNVSLPAPPANVETRVPHTVTLTAGTTLTVRIGETLSSSTNQQGDTFLATLMQPLVIDGFIIAERGARVEGKVLDAGQAGRARGRSHLGISIVRLATSDGQNIRIRTEPFTKDGSSSGASDAAKVGAGAAIGAVIGAIAGGGKGAAIGAGAGGAVGAGDVLLTRGRAVEIPVETRVNFRVQDPVTITERLD